jgi:hypothetical protein
MTETAIGRYFFTHSCCQACESADHVTGHFNIIKLVKNVPIHREVKTHTSFCNYVSETELETSKYKLYWDKATLTD